MATIALFLRMMGAGGFLFVLAVGLRFACLLRVDRLREAGRLPLLLGTLCVVDGILAAARGAAAARPLAAIEYESWLSFARGGDAAFKILAAVACLPWAKRHPSLTIVAAALGFDAFFDVAAIVDGVPTRDLMLQEILCWLIARWGLGRIAREERTLELLAPPAPLWLQVAEASTSGPGREGEA